MTNIPNINEYAKNVTNSAIKPQANNSAKSSANLAQAPLNDTLELTNKQKTKKILTKAGIFAISLASCLAIARRIDISKAKKEITVIYDSIYEYMEQEAKKTGINFEKPKLVFKRQPKMMGTGYVYANNEIQIDPRKWRQNYYISKDLNEVHMQQVADNLEMPYIFYTDKKAENNLRKLNYGEKVTMLGGIFTHELTHAKQFQTILSMENGREKILEKLKEKLSGFSQNELETAFSFVFNYKPKEILKTNQIYEQIAGNHFFAYSLDEAIKSFVDYSNYKESPFEYYTNLAEYCAKASEAKYWRKMSEGAINSPGGVSSDFIKYCNVCTNTVLEKISSTFNKNNG